MLPFRATSHFSCRILWWQARLDGTPKCDKEPSAKPFDSPNQITPPDNTRASEKLLDGLRNFAEARECQEQSDCHQQADRAQHRNRRELGISRGCNDPIPGSALPD